ncbi:MAG: iron-containing alcohol dehydrogenase, partial [Burkholderiales bacterium]
MLKMLTVRLPFQKAYSYPIYIGDNLLNEWQQWLPNYANNRQIVVITDKTVNELYAKSWVAQLECAGYKVLLLIIEPGEKTKTGATKEQLELTMLKHKFDRHGLCIALGGGVVGDLAGFLAATYMRGLKYIQIPTTLLA